MSNTQKSNVLITGATSGFGLQFAKIFAKENQNLIIVSRHQSELDEMAKDFKNIYGGISITPIACDLSEDGAAQKLYNDVKSKNLNIDILINNAGFGEHGLFTETDLEKELKIIHLNIISATVLAKLYLKDMVARKNGKILQLGSVASFIPFPKMAVYGATKAYIWSLSQALYKETEGTGVTITTLCPGASDTEFFERAGAEDTIVMDTPLSDPADVAKAGYDALMNGDRYIVPGMMNKIQVGMSNLLSDTVTGSMAEFLMKEKHAATV